MKSSFIYPIAVVLLLGGACPAFAGKTVHATARGKTVIHKGPRKTVVLHEGFPLRRTHPLVYVRPLRGLFVVPAPSVYLAPVVWPARVVVLPARERLVWQDSETLSRVDEWTEFTLGVGGVRGSALLMAIDGKMKLDFAEIVFENGEATVVDFNSATRGSGTYKLLDFADGRRVSHVRMVGKAQSESARITLYLDR